ncbi:hypothetical protein V6Z11_D10G074200 [Gossypium hirsutum]
MTTERARISSPGTGVRRCTRVEKMHAPGDDARAGPDLLLRRQRKP